MICALRSYKYGLFILNVHVHARVFCIILRFITKILLKSKRTTVKDIAERAGVSRGTVDRVLHDRGRVADDVKVKVQQAIEALEYKPNLVARSMATQKTFTIACLLPDPKDKKAFPRRDLNPGLVGENHIS